MKQQSINEQKPERMPCGTCDYYSHHCKAYADGVFYGEEHFCTHPAFMKYNGMEAIPQPTSLLNKDGLCPNHTERR